VCLALLKSNDVFIPFCNYLEKEMERCVLALGLNSRELIPEFEQRKKTKRSQIMREKLREDEYKSWCALPEKGKGVDLFQDSKIGNQVIVEKRGLTNSEWTTAMKMSARVIPVRTLPGRTTDSSICRKCGVERETLGHVLGSCQAGELLRNHRHHEVRSIIAKHLRKQGWTVFEEVTCLMEGGSSKRVDIWCYNESTNEGYILDPTVRLETSAQQPQEVDIEKKSHYVPCIPYFREKYKIDNIEVTGLLVGARGTITKFFEEFRKKFKLSKIIIEEIVISCIRNSCKILHNHLYKV
jgi:hypothetical protein